MKKADTIKRLAAVCAAVMAIHGVAGTAAVYAVDLPGAEETYSLSAEKAGQGAELSWEAVPEALDYVIYRARCDEEGELLGEFEKIAVTRKTEYADLSARGDRDKDGKPKLYVYKICPRFKKNGAPEMGEPSGLVYTYAGLIIRADENDGVELGEGSEYDGDDEAGAAVDAGEGAEGAGDVIEYEPDYDEDIAYEPEEDITDDAYGSYEEMTAGTLTAEEWRDNRNFDDYIKLTETAQWKDEYKNYRIKTSRRYSVTVRDSSGKTVENAVVTLKAGGRVLGRARTDNKGRAYVYYNIFGRNEIPSVLEISAGSEKRRIHLPRRGTCGSLTVKLFGEVQEAPKALDLMFVIDTTGSMGDELRYLQTEFLDVIDRVDSANPDLDKRASVNFYRDHGDDYVVRAFPFTDDMKTASKQLSAQNATGGGDYPEALDEALDNAVSGHAWREDSTKIMFLVLDAPAHSSPEITRSLVSTAKKAAEKGIRIIPIVSSGAEFDVEYLMRSMAVITGGTYVYLTDDSGVGYSHLAPTIPEDPETEKLNELMIRVINEYLL